MTSPLFIDSDILIWHLRGLPVAERTLRRLDEDESSLWICAVQRIEILFYLRSGEERRAQDLLARFATVPLTNDTLDHAAEIFRYWNPRAGTGQFDAVIAASVIERDGVLVTNNVRHFPMPGLRVEQAWDVDTP